MTVTYDSLGFAQALRQAGIPQKHAEAHAAAIRDKVMPELATKADIAELRHMIERQTLQLTVRLGGLVLAGVGALVAFRFFA